MRTLAAIFAHPDDETFSIGGTVARYVSEGMGCQLYCATDGRAGRASGVPVESREELGSLRRAELREAARLLGFRGVRIGGYMDGALAAADADALVGELVAFLREHRPQVVLTFGPEGARNGHSDHRAISRAATAAFFLARLRTAYPEQIETGWATHAPDRLYYVTWSPPAPDDPLPIEGLPTTAMISVAGWRDRKRAAFAAHVTQQDHRERFEALALGESEAFALAAGVPQPEQIVADLFAGL